ncbi:MAG: branched-chain amino acid ABC transporter permease [Planctomycetota bacterium]|jgi:branched-chain amino acid transport system permease protein|nr:branched-chain amino acid ABC transporter permease [Planctomycetota bacterium]
MSDTFVYYAQLVVDGLAQGAIYALMAIGFAVIMGSLDLVTFTYGEVVMLGALAGGYYGVAILKLGIWLSLLLGFAAAWLVGMFIDVVCYRRWPGGPPEVWLITTIGISTVLKSGSQVLFSTEQEFVPDVMDGMWEIGDLRVLHIQVLIIGVLFFLSASLWVFLGKTRLGMQLRAVSMDKTAAALLGVRVQRVMTIGNAIGCALGGVAGVLLGAYYNSVFAIMGGVAGIKAFAAAVFGGLTSIPGAALGGLLLGVLENLGVDLFSSGWRDIIGFGVMIIVLLIKPSGLLGRKGAEKI